MEMETVHPSRIRTRLVAHTATSLESFTAAATEAAATSAHLATNPSAHPTALTRADPQSMPYISIYTSELLVLHTVLLCLSIVFVFARFWSRALLPKKRFWWDDWLVLVNLIIFALQFGVYHLPVDVRKVVGIKGQEEILGTKENLQHALKIGFALGFLRPLLLGLSKISTLLFYTRAFQKQQSKTWTATWWLTLGLSVAWTVAGLVVTATQCVPTQKIWEPLATAGQCIDTRAWYTGSTVADVAIDLMILLLPIPLLARMQLRLRKKIFVTLLFIFGYCVVAVSLARLVILVETYHDKGVERISTDARPPILITLEEGVALIGICLPSVFFLLRRTYCHGVRSLFSTKTDSQASPSERSGSSHQSLRRQHDKESQATVASMEEPFTLHGANDRDESLRSGVSSLSSAPSLAPAPYSHRTTINKGKYLDV